MKKIIALLATFALILAVAPMSFAADVNYIVKLGDAVNVGGTNIYPLAISIDSINASSGHLTLKWNREQVRPYFNLMGMMAGELNSSNVASGLANHYVVSNGGKVELVHSSYLDNGYYEIDWSATNYTAGNVFLTLYFGLQGSTTTADFNADTFTLPSSTELETLGTTNIKAGGAYGTKVPGTEYYQSTGACGIDFQTYTKGADPIAATKVVLDKTEATINTIGETVTLTAKVYGADDVEATNQNVTWSTSDDKVATVADGVVTVVADGTATITATSEDGNFTATCAITVDADWEAEPADKTEWKNGFEFKGQDGTTKTDNTVKKLVIFGKNSTKTALAAKSYGVKIGINEYKGVLPVPAGSSWAIIILDENGQKVALDNYSYTAFVGDKTVFSGNVNAQ